MKETLRTTHIDITLPGLLFSKAIEKPKLTASEISNAQDPMAWTVNGKNPGILGPELHVLRRFEKFMVSFVGSTGKVKGQEDYKAMCSGRIYYR